MLLSGDVALIGGNSTNPGSSYYALIKAVLSLSWAPGPGHLQDAWAVGTGSDYMRLRIRTGAFECPMATCAGHGVEETGPEIEIVFL